MHDAFVLPGGGGGGVGRGPVTSLADPTPTPTPSWQVPASLTCALCRTSSQSGERPTQTHTCAPLTSCSPPLCSPPLAGACKFDLRFVPDEQSFEGREVRDSATEVPAGYEPPTFQTKVSRHGNSRSIGGGGGGHMVVLWWCGTAPPRCLPAMSLPDQGELAGWVGGWVGPAHQRGPDLRWLFPGLAHPLSHLNTYLHTAFPSPPQALQHTSVSLTWDADDEGRKRALSKKMTADDIREDDFAVRGLSFHLFRSSVCACVCVCGWGCV